MTQFPLLNLNPKQRGTRDLIFSVLASRFPLALVEIQKELKEQTKLKISYQGIRRALLLLKRDGVVSKSKAGYALSRVWLETAKTTLDIAYELAKGSRNRRFKLTDLNQPLTKYTCNSLYEADNFWGDLLFAYTVPKLRDGAVSVLSLNHSAWSMLFNTGRETELFKRLEGIGVHTKLIFSANNAFNRRALKAYHQVGSEAVIDSNLPISSEVHWNIIGDFVIQVNLQPKIARLISKLVQQKIDKIDEFNRALLAHQKTEVLFTLQNNKALADQLRKIPEKSAPYKRKKIRNSHIS